MFDFRKGWCNFNHFTYTNENLPADREGFQDVIRRLLRRNAALQLAPNQPYWDLLLPVYTGDINKPIERDHLSAIFVQIQNRQKPEKLTLGTEYRKYYRPDQLGCCIQLEFGTGRGKRSTQMRWPLCEGTGKDIRATEPFVFGMQDFGDDGKIFPFLAKHPALHNACASLLRTLESMSPFLEERPMLRTLDGFVMKAPKSSGGLGHGGASGGGMGGNGGDDTRMSEELVGGDDMDGRTGDDVPMSGM
jgi:hypothetical protein